MAPEYVLFVYYFKTDYDFLQLWFYLLSFTTKCPPNRCLYLLSTLLKLASIQTKLPKSPITFLPLNPKDTLHSPYLSRMQRNWTYLLKHLHPNSLIIFSYFSFNLLLNELLRIKSWVSFYTFSRQPSSYKTPSIPASPIWINGISSIIYLNQKPSNFFNFYSPFPIIHNDQILSNILALSRVHFSPSAITLHQGSIHSSLDDLDKPSYLVFLNFLLESPLPQWTFKTSYVKNIILLLMTQINPLLRIKSNTIGSKTLCDLALAYLSTFTLESIFISF